MQPYPTPLQDGWRLKPRLKAFRHQTRLRGFPQPRRAGRSRLLPMLAYTGGESAQADLVAAGPEARIYSPAGGAVRPFARSPLLDIDKAI
jgi:hypothetical protein